MKVILSKKLFLSIILSLFMISIAFAEESNNQCIITSDQIIEFAQNNPALKQKGFQLKTSQLAVRYATMWENPEISIDSAYKTGGISGMTLGISISQKLPFLGKESTYEKLNEHNARMSEINMRYAALMSEAESLRLAYKIYILDQKIEFYKKHLESLNIVFAHRSTMHKKSPARWARITNLSIYKNRIKNEVVILLNARNNALGELNALLGKEISDDCTFSFKDTIKEKLNWNVIREHTQKNIDEKNYHLLLLKERKRRENTELRLAEKMKYPDVTIVGYYNSEPGNPNDRYYGAGVSMPIPVINRSQSEIKIAENSIEKTQHEITMTSNAYHLMVQSGLNNLKELSILHSEEKNFIQKEIPDKEAVFRVNMIRQRIDVDDYLVFLQESQEYIIGYLDLQEKTWNLMINIGLYSGQKNYWAQFYD